MQGARYGSGASGELQKALGKISFSYGSLPTKPLLKSNGIVRALQSLRPSNDLLFFLRLRRV
jgi:hypothetical protein